MNKIRVEQITEHLNLQDTEKLLEIWQEQNPDEWDPVVFEVIEDILFSRLGFVPQPSHRVIERRLLVSINHHIKAGDFDVALSECDEAIQVVPDLAMAYYYRGQIYNTKGEREKAFFDLQKAIQLDPELDCALKLMKPLEKDLEKEYMHSPSRKHLERLLEWIYDDNIEDALSEYELANRELPSIALAYYDLGFILEALQQLESAIDAYSKALQLNPRFYPARDNLANARFRYEEEQYRLVGSKLTEEVITRDDDGEPLDTHTADESQEDSEADIPLPGWAYLDEKAFILAGWPGHRTRPGRSGYDPLETDFEHAHMIGVMIRLSLIRKFRTHNPIYLLVMIFTGCLLCLPLIASPGIFKGDWMVLILILICSPNVLVGMALLVNVGLSFVSKKPDVSEKAGDTFF